MTLAPADVPKAAALLMLVILSLWFGRLTQLPLRGGPSRIVSLELAPTVQAANRFLDTWKAARPKRWRDDLKEAQGWDTWFICVYAPLFTLLCWLAADHFATAHARWSALGQTLAGAQLLAGGLDFVENAAMQKMIDAGVASAPWPLICSTASGIKWVLIALFVMYGTYALVHRAFCLP